MEVDGFKIVVKQTFADSENSAVDELESQILLRYIIVRVILYDIA